MGDWRKVEAQVEAACRSGRGYQLAGTGLYPPIYQNTVRTGGPPSSRARRRARRSRRTTGASSGGAASNMWSKSSTARRNSRLARRVQLGAPNLSPRAASSGGAPAAPASVTDEREPPRALRRQLQRQPEREARVRGLERRGAWRERRQRPPRGRARPRKTRPSDDGSIRRLLQLDLLDRHDQLLARPARPPGRAISVHASCMKARKSSRLRSESEAPRS